MYSVKWSSRLNALYQCDVIYRPFVRCSLYTCLFRSQPYPAFLWAANRMKTSFVSDKHHFDNSSTDVVDWQYCLQAFVSDKHHFDNNSTDVVDW
jgi:hypothetical protein